MFNWKHDLTATLTFRFSCVKFGVERSLRLQKRHCQSLKNRICTVSNFIALIPHLFQFVKCWQVFLELNPKRLYRSPEKAKEICCLVFTSSRKREIRHFYAVVVQWRQRNTAISRKVVGKSARDNPKRYCGRYWVRCSSKKFERMAQEAMGVCLRVLKESNKRSFDSYSVWNSVLIISHKTFRDCRVHIFTDNISRNSCIQKSVKHVQSCYFANLNLLLFWRSCCPRRRRYVSSLMLSIRDLGKVDIQ